MMLSRFNIRYCIFEYYTKKDKFVIDAKRCDSATSFSLEKYILGSINSTRKMWRSWIDVDFKRFLETSRSPRYAFRVGIDCCRQDDILHFCREHMSAFRVRLQRDPKGRPILF